jgi:hypothetical protein
MKTVFNRQAPGFCRVPRLMSERNKGFLRRLRILSASAVAVLAGCACNCETPDEALLAALGVDAQNATNMTTAEISRHANAFLIGKRVTAFMLDDTHPPKTCAQRTSARIDCVYVFREGIFSDEFLRVVIDAGPDGVISGVAVKRAEG